MKATIFKSLLFISLSASVLSSCVNDDDYNIPALECTEPNLVANKTIQEIFAGAVAAPTLYSGDDIVEAYVVSSDKGGNYFKTLYLQSLDGSIAFMVPADYANLATIYQPGRKVFVKMKGLYTQIKDGALMVGRLDNGSVWRISQFDTPKIIVRSCASSIDEDQIVKHLTIAEAIGSNAHLDKLVEFDNVQFKNGDAGQPYYITGTSGTNRTLTDANGSEIIVRSTSFTKFGSQIIPDKNGKVRGVLTRFGSTFQFIPRYDTDIKLTNPRLNISTTAIGGTAIQYVSTLNENFESFAVANRIFPGYVNDAFVGTRYWEVKSFNNNKYIQMSANASGGANKVYLVVPVNMTAANTFAFKTNDGYNNGGVLKVYYSTNYVPLGDISAATLVNITSSFTIASGSTSGYGTAFINSGNYSIPSTVTGNGFFIFEYTGSAVAPIVTTTMQIDDIVIN
ncbi:DUF5689 domain-containing protein [Flavobacterium sp. '19STA2R22 D10 B1']|uniref:DUF5689 domain-containing protein n=1 Tax=Flavobacterium aerium TaxID=3037261 RepID=UPI00278BF1E4|nr:DUF5689 domain-containing protein [Flavobacterium sp. '19STA2R22 D10 B1']